MKNFDNFDESVKNKLDDMNFKFNEANWEKMSQMIDASRPAKKPFANIPVISSIIIGGALLVSSIWYFTSQASTTNEVAQNNNSVVSANTLNDANSKTENTTLSSDLSNANASSNNSNTNLEVTSITNANPSSTANERDELSVKQESSIIENSATSKKNVSGKKSTTTAANEFATRSNGSSEVNVTKTETSNTDVKVVVGETEGAHVKTTPNTSENSSSSSDVAKTNTNSNDNMKPELANVDNQKAVGDEKNNTSTDPEETDVIALPSTTTNLGQTEDAIAAANLKTAIEDKKVKEYVRIKHHTMNIEGGVNNSFGWKVNTTRNGNNISPILGINYMYNIDSRSSLLVGLQYNSLANLGEAKANFSITTYGFGINNDVTTYKLSDLHYAVMPLKFIYKLNKNNAFGVGFNMMYLMNTRTEIINTTTLESNVTTTQSRYEYGYCFDQLNKFNAQLALNYNYSISKTLGLNLEINKSLGNVLKDYKYYGVINQSNAPAAVKLSLTYTLFNK
jgi:hypothetical protein